MLEKSGIGVISVSDSGTGLCPVGPGVTNCTGWEVLSCDPVGWSCDPVSWSCDPVSFSCDLSCDPGSEGPCTVSVGGTEATPTRGCGLNILFRRGRGEDS